MKARCVPDEDAAVGDRFDQVRRHPSSIQAVRIGIRFVKMLVRAFWLNLGWLVILVVTVAVPLGLDAVGRLTYFTSLAFWGIPILYLWPVFNTLTAEGTGRRRRAMRYAAGTIVVLGIVLDFLFGFLTLRFPGCS